MPHWTLTPIADLINPAELRTITKASRILIFSGTIETLEGINKHLKFDQNVTCN